MKRADYGAYGLMVIDAFSSDSIPVHLLTNEAMQLYLDRLTDDGKCKECGRAIAGHFGKFEKAFGSRRIPVRLANFHAA